MFAASAAKRNGNERTGSGSSQAYVRCRVPWNMWKLWINHSPGFILILHWVPGFCSAYTITALALFWLEQVWRISCLAWRHFPNRLPFKSSPHDRCSDVIPREILLPPVSSHLVWSEMRMEFIADLTWTSCKWLREYVMYDWGCQKWTNTSHNGN